MRSATPGDITRTCVIHRAGGKALLYLSLAVAAAPLAFVVPAVCASPWLAALLMGAPLLGTAILCGLLGIGAWQTRLELRADTFDLRAPTWRGGAPARSCTHLRGAWSEVLRVRRRTEWYGVRLPPFFVRADLPVEVYRIDTSAGHIELDGRCPGLSDILARAGVEVSVESPVRQSWLRALLRGPAPWPEVDRSSALST